MNGSCIKKEIVLKLSEEERAWFREVLKSEEVKQAYNGNMERATFLHELSQKLR